MAKNSSDIPSPKTRSQYDKLVKRGARHFEKNEYTSALKYFSKALDYKNYQPNTLVNMARCLFQLGMKTKAISMMEHALDQNAENPGICDSLGNACLQMDLYDLAVKFYTIYCQLKPEDPLGYNNLASAMREAGQLDQSIDMLQQIIPIYPDNPFLWNSIGASVSFRDGYPAAQPFYEEAYRLDPSTPNVVNNLCLVYANLGLYEKAWEFAHKAVKLDSASFMAQRGLAHCSYNIGKFDDAFKALAWHNHVSDANSVFMPYNIEKWTGQDLKGKTILIGAEQGVGDEILMCGLYPSVIKEAKHVIIGCDPRLVDLFRNSFRDATVLPYISGQHELGYKVRMYEGVKPEEVDYMCLYTELMRYRWRSVEDIPDMSSGILAPAKDKIRFWKDKLSTLPHDINVGLCWRSGLLLARRKENYSGLDDWAPLLKCDGVNFINVQYGDCQEEIRQFEAKTGLKIHQFEDLDLKDDFEGTAALMKNLDLVMGPATTPLPLAATSGCTAWWLNPRRPWYSFGDKHGIPIFKKARNTIKPTDMTWPDFFPIFTEEEFLPWLRKLKASKN